MATEKLGIKVEHNPPVTKIAQLGICELPKEVCYVLEGKVKVFTEESGDEFVEIGAGDLVEFSKGMKVTWDVSVAVNKHYYLEE